MWILDASPISARSLFSEAFLLAVTNPKALLFYMALFPQILDPANDLAPQSSLLVVTYCGLSIASLSTYSMLANILITRLLTQKRYDGFRKISGAILISFAAKLMLEL